ncbi:MAG: putative LPS assembly protein LptD, partial [Bacteroidota bacterium]
DTFYADRLSYTTCNLKHPHFHIGAQRAKIIQDDKIISGPFSLYFGNVPTPLGFFSGLMYFKTKGSGILVPGYGGESSRGFRLENLGYYFRFNDYINLTLKGAVYSKGSVNFRAESRYKRRYTYSGELSYQESMNLEPQERRLPKGEKTWRFVWNHRTESNPNSSLMACVDLQSQSYRKTMVAGEGSLNPTVNSSIRYTNKLVGILPHTLNVKLGYNKNFKRNDAKAILPELSLRTGNLYPLRTLGLSGGAWYADTYLQHSLEFKNALSNKIGEEEVDFTPENWGRIFKRGRCGVKNTFPVKTNIKLGYLNITPFLEYRERWYWEKIDYRYEPVIQDFEEDQIAGFARVYDYNFGLGANTTVYGTHVFGQENTIQAIRHQMEPKVNFTYVPDFSKPSLNYWQTVQHQGKVQKKSRFKEGVYGYPPERDKAMIQIKLSNSLEIKLRRENEEEGTTSKKVPILEGFDWSTAYDFLDKEYPLKDIQLQARTRLFDGLININANTTFDPYIYQAYHDGGRQRFRRIKEFAWIHGRGIGRVKKSALSVNTKLSSKGYQEDDTNAFMGNMQESPATTKEQRGMQVYPAQYVDFDVPWSLRLGYEWSYQSTDPAQKQINRSVLLNGNASISARWKVTFSTEYDLKKEKFVGSRTQIGVYRDLHCWEMKLTWQPLGKQKYYDFSIGVKAPILQSLKLSRSSPYSTPMPKGEE